MIGKEVPTKYDLYQQFTIIPKKFKQQKNTSPLRTISFSIYIVYH
jgi:hypothetical protein